LAVKAIEAFPYWNDNRALLEDLVRLARDEDLEFRPAPGLRPLGEVLRHIITTEEYWWHGGILCEPFERWRPADWDSYSVEEKERHRARRFPTKETILDGLQAAHAPVAAFMREFAETDLCERRRPTWGGGENSLRWILSHLVEHDLHHRGQVFTRLRLLGYDPPSTFPRPAVMGWTPAVNWREGEIEISHIVPVASLSDADLAFRPSPALPSAHDLVLHIFVWEDFLIRQTLKGEADQDWGPIEGWFRKGRVDDLAATLGSRFPSPASLVAAMDAVGHATASFIDGVSVHDLPRAHDTPWGLQTLHHTLWYAREHMVHHRGQVFLRIRMLGKTPPEI
jgi:uncharacterized damage-inducible protein DinB